ncbi:E3 ubiquitin-protein ligase Topors-like isoform X2, partial [Leptotrombidium deliense]
MASSAKKQKLSRDLHNRGKQDGRSSPEINCPICLERIEDRAFANKCFHSFCKTCLVEWSKVKAECPVCRQRFEKIIYNVKAMDDYQEETVQRQQFMDLPCWHNLD